MDEIYKEAQAVSSIHHDEVTISSHEGAQIFDPGVWNSRHRLLHFTHSALTMSTGDEISEINPRSDS